MGLERCPRQYTASVCRAVNSLFTTLPRVLSGFNGSPLHTRVYSIISSCATQRLRSLSPLQLSASLSHIYWWVLLVHTRWWGFLYPISYLIIRLPISYSFINIYVFNNELGSTQAVMMFAHGPLIVLTDVCRRSLDNSKGHWLLYVLKVTQDTSPMHGNVMFITTITVR